MYFSKPISVLAAVAFGVTCAASDSDLNQTNLLIFTKTEGFRHERATSIPHGIDLVTSIANERGWAVTATEDASVFTEEGLGAYTTLVFISTTGNFLLPSETAALEKFMLNGGSWLGIHAAGDFGDSLPKWYSNLVGSQFRSHPCQSTANCDEANKERYPPYGNVRPDILTIETHEHPSTARLPTTYNRTDEWYSYKINVADLPETYTVLITLAETYIDEITLLPELEHMDPHPISWYSLYEGKGRSFYTGQGHTNETYYDPYFIEHITGGLEWVTGSTD